MKEQLQFTVAWQICAFLVHDFVLCNNGSSLVVQKLQLISAEVRLVSIACSSTLMAGQHTWETLLSSERCGRVLAISSNSCRGHRESSKDIIWSERGTTCNVWGAKSRLFFRAQTLSNLNIRYVLYWSWNRSCSRQQWQFLPQAGLLFGGGKTTKVGVQ